MNKSTKPKRRTSRGRSLSQHSPGNATANTMSNKTKVFIQKICYKRAASIDMTKNGFMKYTDKIHHLNILLRPLKEQLDKILGKQPENPANSRRRSLSRRRSRSKKSVSVRTPPSSKRSHSRSKGPRESAARRRPMKKLMKKNSNKLKKSINKQSTVKTKI